MPQWIRDWWASLTASGRTVAMVIIGVILLAMVITTVFGADWTALWR